MIFTIGLTIWKAFNAFQNIGKLGWEDLFHTDISSTSKVYFNIFKIMFEHVWLQFYIWYSFRYTFNLKGGTAADRNNQGQIAYLIPKSIHPLLYFCIVFIKDGARSSALAYSPQWNYRGPLCSGHWSPVCLALATFWRFGPYKRITYITVYCRCFGVIFCSHENSVHLSLVNIYLRVLSSLGL